MKRRITPVDVEITVPADRFIVSKTDLTGRITYANRTFMEVANFTEQDLLTVQHNVVRHPDMPRGVFRFLWNTLKQEREFFGFVKNMTSAGAYYWVFANVTPDRDASGRVQGYYSVRRRPSREAIQAVAPLYAQMLAIERQVSPAEAPDASLRWLEQTLAGMGKSYEELVLGLI